MAVSKHWVVDIYLTEGTRKDGEARTHAEACLRTWDTTSLTSAGDARKHPGDPDVPEIGDEVAAARALTQLAERLLGTAAEDIEAATHRPVHSLRA